MLKQFIKLKPKFVVGEVVLTADNGYVKILEIEAIGGWYVCQYYISVELIKPAKYKTQDVYYNFKGFTKLPKNSIVRLLFE